MLSDQILRSIGVFHASIAKGINRSKEKYLNSLEIALGEADETEKWLYKLRDANLLDRNTANKRIFECIEVQKMLNGLIRSIRKNEN